MERWPVLRVVRLVSVLVVLAAIVAQAKTLVDANAFDPTRFFAFFTIQSNLVGVAAFSWLVARPDGPRSRGIELLRAGAAIYLTVTFLVVIILLNGVDVQLQLVWVDVVLHKIFPIIVVADLLLDPPRTRLVMGDIVTLLIYPLVWTLLTVIRGAVDPARWYPYPFLDPAKGGYGQVAVTIVAVVIGFVVIAVAYIRLANWRRSARDLRREAERLDLRLDRDLRLGIAVDEEDGFREARRPGRLAVGEMAQPIEQLGLVRVGGEAADRADLAADLARLAVELHGRRPGLEVGAERALALVADEQERRGRIADQVAQMAEHPAAGQHPVRGHDHVRTLGLGDLLRVANVAGLGLVRVVER